MLKITLKTIKDVIKKTYEESKDEYVRLSFLGEDNNGVDQIYKTSLSMEQWKSLKDIMGISVDEEQNFSNVSSIALEYNEGDKTSGKTPKPMVERKFGVYKGYGFDYYELHQGLFIKNEIVPKTQFKKDLSGLF